MGALLQPYLRNDNDGDKVGEIFLEALGIDKKSREGQRMLTNRAVESMKYMKHKEANLDEAGHQKGSVGGESGAEMAGILSITKRLATG